MPAAVRIGQWRSHRGTAAARAAIDARVAPWSPGEANARWISTLLILVDKFLKIHEVSLKNPSEWQELTRLSRGEPMVVERVRLVDQGIAIEGSFELPQLARLTVEDQVFVTAFVRCHGSIKEMERIFGISYPTVKSRLNRIAGLLEFVDTNPTPSRAEVLDRLKRGEISAQDAISELEGLR